LEQEVKFARTNIEVDGETVAKVTTYSRAVEVAEEDITGSMDYIAGTNVLHQQYASISVGETAEMEGISMESNETGLNAGQSELKDAAETGKTVTLRHTKHTGFGYVFSGFFTSYEESAGVSEVYKWKGSFRINSKTEITPGS
jgi:hypothetical protein